jgi:ferredoxin
VDAPFEVLGVDPDADESEIDRAYRRRVMETHPDQGGSARAFQRVKAAYEAIMEGRLHDGDGDGDADRREPSRPEGSRVEYLNYAVIEDHGWSLDDDDLFEKAAATDLPNADHGRLLVEPDESLLEAAENRGFSWPFSCRGGACANCAVYLVEGELSQPANHILSEEHAERGFRLSCNGYPVSDELKVVFNVKHLPELDELRLPPGPFRRVRTD